MLPAMPLRFLRPGLPTRSTLTVSSLPCRAKLDQNESPEDLPADLKADLLREVEAASWNRYPQPVEYAEAKRAFAEALGLDPDRVALTAGCDQAIQGAHFVAGGPGRRALVFEPTYPMLAHAGLMAGTEVERVELGPAYALSPDRVAGDHHLVLVASPNNPTGSSVPRAVVEAALAGPRYVFVDEAYHDLARTTVADLLDPCPNLMIGRSCSKALLAGMRLGYALARPEVALRLEQVLTAPYHLSIPQLVLARRFAEVRPHVERACDRVIAERGRLAAALAGLGLGVYPSEANFLLLRAPRARELYEGLARAGLRLRYAPLIPGLEGHLRVTVGAPAEDDLLVELLAGLLDAPG